MQLRWSAAACSQSVPLPLDHDNILSTCHISSVSWRSSGGVDCSVLAAGGSLRSMLDALCRHNRDERHRACIAAPQANRLCHGCANIAHKCSSRVELGLSSVLHTCWHSTERKCLFAGEIKCRANVFRQRSSTLNNNPLAIIEYGF